MAKGAAVGCLAAGAGGCSLAGAELLHEKARCKTTTGASMRKREACLKKTSLQEPEPVHVSCPKASGPPETPRRATALSRHLEGSEEGLRKGYEGGMRGRKSTTTTDLANLVKPLHLFIAQTLAGSMSWAKETAKVKPAPMSRTAVSHPLAATLREPPERAAGVGFAAEQPRGEGQEASAQGTLCVLALFPLAGELIRVAPLRDPPHCQVWLDLAGGFKPCCGRLIDRQIDNVIVRALFLYEMGLKMTPHPEGACPACLSLKYAKQRENTTEAAMDPRGFGKKTPLVVMFQPTLHHFCLALVQDPLRAPQDESWLQKDAGTRFLPSSQLALGCSWAGKSCVSPLEWHGLAQLRPCESFAPWASVTRVMGSTAAAAARDLLRQLREGGSGMERGTSPCLILGFSSGGFHRLCFHELCRGALLLPSIEAGVLRFCSTPGQCLGRERSPHRQLENGPPVNAKSLPVSGKFKPVKTLRGTAANKYDLSHPQAPPPPALCKLNFKFPPTLVPACPIPAGLVTHGSDFVACQMAVTCLLHVFEGRLRDGLGMASRGTPPNLNSGERKGKCKPYPFPKLLLSTTGTSKCLDRGGYIFVLRNLPGVELTGERECSSELSPGGLQEEKARRDMAALQKNKGLFLSRDLGSDYSRLEDSSSHLSCLLWGPQPFIPR
ncbi:hypothetical protein Anapl_13873 [Anas platyrhynchos]|uniref:Uncharacterized protein n=1 Tax=Anas platyrhynchos TaxID=8839 RepID=R0L151_ANAPL|nr:hypothetical protein Anapl_13873 [Anas platyrhynchos]